MSETPTYWIEQPDQLAVLTSPMAQEVFDAIQSMQPCSVRDIAMALGVPADGLYYHLAKLEGARLIASEQASDTSEIRGRQYRLAHPRMLLHFKPDDENNRATLNRAVASMLRMVGKDFQQGFESTEAITRGPERNLRAARFRAWLNQQELAEIDQCFDRVISILRGSRRRTDDDSTLCVVSWFMSPKDPQPSRRPSASKESQS